MTALPVLQLGSLVLERPLWLIGLVPLFALLLRASAATGDDWRRIADPGLLHHLRDPSTGGRPWRRWMVGGVAIAVTLALAGPSLEADSGPPLRPDSGLVIALDVSPSMDLPDVAPTRMAAARAAAAEAIGAAGARQVALVVYAGDAYLLSPFSTDPAVTLSALAAAQPGLVPERGSRPLAGLKLATTLLGESGLAEGSVLLVSDGGGIDETTLAQAGSTRYQTDTVLAGPSLQVGPLRRLAAAGHGSCACDDDTTVADLLRSARWSLVSLRPDGRGEGTRALSPLLWPLLVPGLAMAGLLFGRSRA